MRATASTQHSSIVGACVVSIVFAIYDGVLFWQGRAPSEHLFDLHIFLLTLLLVTWFVADSAARQRFVPSFDYGWFIWAMLPFFAPYYLVSTRRWRGVVLCIGMLLLFLLPWLVEVVVSYVG
jgi:hypothetical protein